MFFPLIPGKDNYYFKFNGILHFSYKIQNTNFNNFRNSDGTT